MIDVATVTGGEYVFLVATAAAAADFNTLTEPRREFAGQANQ
jgi:hypothetical protein